MDGEIPMNESEILTQRMDEPVVELKKSRKPRSKRAENELVGSKLNVWNGVAHVTGGGLRKEDLMWDPKNKKPISKKKHEKGKELIEKARRAKDNPDDPLFQKMKPFWDHQFKPKGPKDIAEEKGNAEVEKLSEIIKE